VTWYFARVKTTAQATPMLPPPTMATPVSGASSVVVVTGQR
jgi:hypothetical protein